MSYFLFLLFLFGRYHPQIYAVNGESQICGYNGDSFICCSGYKKDDQGECTLPICENGCGIGGECIRPDTCFCSNGRVSSSCLEVSEQNNNNIYDKKETPGLCSNNCNGQGVCINSKCKCHLGYSGYSCLEKHVDQCYMSLSRGICQKSIKEMKLNIELCCGAFNVAWGDPCQKCPKSRCLKGFMEIDGICRDVNECTISYLCQSGRCENLEGSYKCICPFGYQFNIAKGDCIKTKDVCKQLPKVCGAGMTCLTLPMGNYSCQCLEGYIITADQKACKRKVQNTFNFCAVYGSFICQYGKCKPDGNNYKCECNPGYKPSGDNKSCKKNIDYCALYENSLCQNGICVSIGDDYVCKCDTGYTASLNRKKCTSLCDLYPTSLCQNAKCIPQSGGGYECRCNNGYLAVGKGKECRRIMNDQSDSSSASKTNIQSAYDTDFCSYDYYKKKCLGGKCINKKSYYQCECLSGFVKDKNGLACKALDKPISDQMLDMAGSNEFKSYCDKYGSFLCVNGQCVESGSSYQCRCNSGYKETSDGKSCYDIDECSMDSNICIQGTCTNSPGSYQCSCYDGFTIHYLPGGPKCYDRNECEENKMMCINGRCINKWGSYSCSCNFGYTKSNDEKQCLPFKISSGPEAVTQEIQCRDCSGLCTKLNATYYQCDCAAGLGSVLNTGLCVLLTQVKDIQFDIPSIDITAENQNKFHSKDIFFQLEFGFNKETFLKQVSTRYRSTVIYQCKSLIDSIRNGILCSFNNGNLNET